MKKINTNLIVLSVIANICFSCVENIITINVSPNKLTNIIFSSEGDSSDIFNSDYIHPLNKNEKIKYHLKINHINTDSTYIKITDFFLIDSSFTLDTDNYNGLTYSYSDSKSDGYLSTIYKVKLVFHGRGINVDYPKLNEAIIHDNLDSLYWLSEVIAKNIEKSILDISKESNLKIDFIRISNHFKNSLSRLSVYEDYIYIKNNRIKFITDILRPFTSDKILIDQISQNMIVYEERVKQILELNDDTFLIKLNMPGSPTNENSHKYENKTMIWSFGVDQVLSDDYIIFGESIVYKIKNIQYLLLSLIFSTSLIIIINTRIK